MESKKVTIMWYEEGDLVYTPRGCSVVLDSYVCSDDRGFYVGQTVKVRLKHNGETIFMEGEYLSLITQEEYDKEVENV